MGGGCLESGRSGAEHALFVLATMRLAALVSALA